ncbi:APC family permease [Streptomyces sp. WAC06614]|uniref:APC family permease n=1 Tax=Streptomyces sp. WAC06614 TaxID=2487416 RepID=UPI001C8D66E0|nr:APC family permease [Streptomyces sp. WAC06614]
MAEPAGDATVRPGLTPFDVTVMVVSIVLGVGIFQTPSLVAQHSGDATAFVLLWLLGGLITVTGALCYAELGSARPDAGGEYAFLREAYGRRLALLFAWARCAVTQPGAIAAAAFVAGDYAAVVAPLGAYGPGVYAFASVVLFTLVNHVGTTPGKWVQRGVEGITVLALLGILIAAFTVPAPPAPAGTPQATSLGGTGLAMMFVLLTYGGWNEAAYLSGELQDARRTMARALVVGVLVVVGVSLAINLAYLHVLGLDGIRESDAVGAAMMRAVAGSTGATITSVVVVLSALTTLNGLIITGARAYYALGRDVAAFRAIGTWRQRGATPANALLLQGAAAAVLVAFGTVTRVGFRAMAAYTAPVFWGFTLLIALSVHVFRRREAGGGGRPHYRVPFYPVTPAVFALGSLWVLWSSLFYAGWGSVVGVVVLLAGTPLLFLEPADRRR